VTTFSAQPGSDGAYQTDPHFMIRCVPRIMSNLASFLFRPRKQQCPGPETDLLVRYGLQSGFSVVTLALSVREEPRIAKSLL
jgi:hypothetical protein